MNTIIQIIRQDTLFKERLLDMNMEIYIFILAGTDERLILKNLISKYGDNDTGLITACSKCILLVCTRPQQDQSTHQYLGGLHFARHTFYNYVVEAFVQSVQEGAYHLASRLYF